MSTSQLYRALGLRGYRVLSIHAEKDVVRLVAEEPNPGTLVCTACGSQQVVRAGRIPRRFHSLPIGGRPVFIELLLQRLLCSDCGLTRQTRIRLADERRSYTRAFERYVLELSRRMTILDVALHLRVGWDMVKDIQKRYLLRHFARPRLKHLRHLAIDEISVGRGHRYVTVVLDLDGGAVVFVGAGKGADALDPFWKRLRAAHARIVAVATDMSPAYIEAVTRNLARATHVFDHFHVIKLFNDRLSQLRRDVQIEAETKLHKTVLKGTRWLLLKNPENLDEKLDERKRLEEALLLNKPLATAYYLKEDLRQIWGQKDRKAGERFMDSWIARAQSSGVRMLQQFAVTLATHRTGILNWYRCPISTGPLEGTNTKIKLMQRQAYGYRDPEFFRLKIYALHTMRQSLIG